MRLHYPIQSACKIELVRFCAQVPAVRVRVRVRVSFRVRVRVRVRVQG